MSMRCVPADYSPSTGEQLFDAPQTPTQLTSEFSGYTSAAAEESIIAQIAVLEASITPRMLQEAATGSVLTGLGAGGAQTAAQFITSVRAQIATLRASI